MLYLWFIHLFPVLFIYLYIIFILFCLVTDLFATLRSNGSVIIMRVPDQSRRVAVAPAWHHIVTPHDISQVLAQQRLSQNWYFIRMSN